MNNTTNEYASEGASATLLPGFMFGFSITTVLTNLPAAIVVLVTVFKSKKPQNSAMLLSLSFSDLLFGISLIAAADLLINTEKMEFSTCRTPIFVLGVAFLASVTHVFTISSERICFICLKIAFFQTHRKAVWMLSVASSWLLSILITGLVYVLLGQNNSDVSGCSLERILDTRYPLYAVYLVVFQSGVLFNLSVLVFYLFKHQQSMKENNIETMSTKNIRSVISISLISAVTTIFGLPIAIVQMYGTVHGPTSTAVRRAVFLLSGLTAISNPIIYIFRLRKYRNYIYNSGRYVLCRDNSVAPVHP